MYSLIYFFSLSTITHSRFRLTAGLLLLLLLLLLGNEMADYVAKQACSEKAQLPGVTICARIRHTLKDPPIQHERTAEQENLMPSLSRKIII